MGVLPFAGDAFPEDTKVGWANLLGLLVKMQCSSHRALQPIPCSKGRQKKCATNQKKRPLNALLDIEIDEKDKQDK